MIKQISFILILSLLVLACDSKKNLKSITEKEETESLIQQSKYCFIQDIRKDSLSYILLFDQIEFGNDTTVNIKKLVELPNGFYFTNSEKKLEAIKLDSLSAIIMQTFSFNDEGNFNFNQKVNISDLADSFEEAPIVRFRQLPFRIVFTGIKVDSLIEIYIP
jgi:hypothetical protein